MTKIAIDSFKSILCLNGDIPDKEFFDQFPALPIIAADNAGMRLIRMGVTPVLVVGDFDSISGELVHERTEFKKYTDQDSTDFEKCILEMTQRLLFPSLVCGAFGGEIDHTINNMHCLMKYGRKSPMVFYDHAVKQKSKCCMPIYDQYNFLATLGESVSLMPYPEARVSVAGLRWNLDNELLSVCGLSSARNMATGGMVEISVHSGQIMLVVESSPSN